MKRGSATSGGADHVLLVTQATKQIVDKFTNLRYIQISYEDHEMNFELSVKDAFHGYTNASFEFRPDIVVRAENKTKGQSIMGDVQLWKSIMDSSAIVFEAETDPKNIFSNILKIEAYKSIKKHLWGRSSYAFVLVVWEDAELPENIEPFDEVWRIKREQDS